MQFLLKGALSALWIVFNTQQVLINLQLTLVTLPANVEITYEMIEATVNFQLVPKKVMYDSLIAKPFNLDQEVDESERPQEDLQKENEDLSSLNQSFGSSVLKNALFIIVTLVFLAVLIRLVILCRQVMLKRCFKPIVSLVRICEQKLMFNAIIRAVLESYLGVCIQMWYGWRGPQAVTDLLSKINLLLLVAMTIYCLVIPVWQFRFLQRN